MNSFPKIALFASYLSLLIALTMYLIKIKRVHIQIHSIGILVIVSALCDLAGYVLAKQKLSTALVVNTFFLSQFFLLSYYYNKTLFAEKPNAVLAISIGQYALAFPLLVFFYHDFGGNHQNFMWLGSSVIVLVYSILFFLRMFRTHESPPAIYTYGNFWINSGVLIYLGACLWLFAFRTDLIGLKIGVEMDRLLWSFHNINNVIKNALFALGFYFSSKDV